jgi:hypothetical protein
MLQINDLTHFGLISVFIYTNKLKTIFTFSTFYNNKPFVISLIFILIKKYQRDE